MKKTQLIEKAAQASGLTKKDTALALDAILDAIGEAVAAGESVQIPGFGTWNVKVQKARTGRNPKTNETIEIPESKRVTFSVGKALKDKANS
ncbi:MAG: HU family DNA-binding protein [Clostridia bacterium]|nr:HU family DNA-binding protein [Clostridia bacterium]MBQ1963080.1 HU family DNA-binding protein [Clostridia bacterium]